MNIMSPDFFSSIVGEKSAQKRGLVGVKIAPAENGKINFRRWFPSKKMVIKLPLLQGAAVH